eukprot:TRINITY_DN3123_c0_g1_i2.p1 TRINITY_DN3123_c0_g1~~TRINITY_DN3123_c0_g1_i2.p1  ORF type:complete len:100 (+),score=21.69 TRINITY_DN3123_c0_g1_i2:370-669(+)
MGSNTENLFFVLKHGGNKSLNYDTVTEAQNDGALTMNYGHFLVKVLNFSLLILVLFFIVKIYNRATRDHLLGKEKACDFCYKSIDIRAVKCPYCTSDQE